MKNLLSISADSNPSGGESNVASSNTCRWTDLNCHALWTDNVELVNKGHIRRNCRDNAKITPPGARTMISISLNQQVGWVAQLFARRLFN